MDETGLMILLLIALSTLSLGVSREYHYVELEKTWTDAQRYCRENFVDLATTETAEDWERMRKIAGSVSGLVWIGLYNDINSWKWSINNAYLYGDGNAKYGEWFVYENRGTELCVEIAGGKLFNRSCDVLQNSVCYDESTNKYIPVTVPMTWSSGQSYCREKYTNLTSMKNQQEKEAIMRVTDRSPWWIGLSRAGWTWSDQSNSSFRMWRENEPSDIGRENCVSVCGAGWCDAPCNWKTPFFCSVPELKLLKVAVKVEGNVDLNVPSVQEAVLNHMEKHMRDHGIHQKFKMRWRKQPNGNIFNKRKG